MTTLFSRYRNVFVAGALIIAAFLVYSFFFREESDTVLSQTEVAESASVDNELIALLLELKALRLDDSVFSNASFQSLQDFSQELIPEPTGRTNPFAPLGAGQ